MKPVYFFNPSYDERNINFYNLGLVSIASHLKRKGIPAYVYMNYLDPTFTKDKDYDLVLEDILKTDPQYIGVSLMTTQYTAALDLSRRIKELSPETHVVWGGQHTTAYGCVDERITIPLWFVVPGWGEHLAEEIYFFGNRKEDKNILNKPLDFTTVVNYSPIERMMRGRMVRQASIMTSYGCPYKCRFCISSLDNKVIFRDINAVVQEVKQVLSMGADSIAFYDDSFFTNIKRTQELLGKLPYFPWLALGRIDDRIKDFGTYQRKGCEEIHFGVESGSQRMIDECVDKKIKVKNVIPTLQKVLDADIMPRASFIIGMPGETVDDVSQTIHLIMEMAEKFGNNFVVNGFFYYPIPNTPMALEATKDLTPQECIDSARLSVHPYKLFEHFDTMYNWLPDKKFFAECWYISRVISEICVPYKYYEGYKPDFDKWGLEVSDETYNRLNVDKLSKKWLDKVRSYWGG